MTEPKSYILIPNPVEAMQHDGSNARAYEILAWIYRSGGKGKLKDGYPNQGPDMLLIQDADNPVLDHNWVVRIPGKGYKILDDVEFKATYTPEPNVRATMRPISGDMLGSRGGGKDG